MNKQEFIDKLAKMSEARTKKEAEEFVNDYHALVRDVLKEGGKVQFVNFGTYAISSRAKRKGVNPRTRQAIVIPEKKVPKFTPGKQLKDAVFSSLILPLQGSTPAITDPLGFFQKERKNRSGRITG